MSQTTTKFPRQVGGALTFFPVEEYIDCQRSGGRSRDFFGSLSQAYRIAAERTGERGCRQRVRLWSQALGEDAQGRPDTLGFWLIEDR